MADAPYQSLYRRYRPQRFSEILGQDHVVMALRNAVRDAKVSHAYLFSGPRGTGKTSAARILAKALNCANPVEGEPDGTCDSCINIQQGNSLDVHELDAASNNGVDAMRDLVSRTALGNPGRWKVYIVDEVHMLSTAASNALLKTLEEPPAHVIFVLATTDPQKVLPTIRSRTQHFEFRLLSPELLGKLVHQVNGNANLHVPETALDLVVRRGKGSARDTLSALDQVAAAGAIDDEQEVIDEITEALCERDTGRALIALAEAMVAGRDAQRVAIDLLEYLRNGFLALMAKELVSLPDNAADHVEEHARRLGAPALVRTMEVLGEAMQNMRDAPEPRVTLEVAIVRLTKPELATDIASLVERIERLERGGGATHASAPLERPAPIRPKTSGPSGSTVPAPVQAVDSVIPPAPTPQPIEAKPALNQEPTTAEAPAQAKLVNEPRSARNTAASEPRRAVAPSPTPSVVAPPPPRPSLGGIRRQPQAAARPTEFPSVEDVTIDPPEPSAPATMPSLESVQEAWTSSVLESLPQRAKARYRSGRFVGIVDGKLQFALENGIHRDRCEEVRSEVEAALRGHFGIHIPLQLIIEDRAAPAVQAPTARPPEEEHDDEEELEIDENFVGEPLKVASPEERLLQAFPGSEDVT